MDAYWIDPGHNNFCCGTVYLSTLRNCYSETWPVCSHGKSDLIAEMCRTLFWHKSWMLGQGLGSIDLRGEKMKYMCTNTSMAWISTASLQLPFRVLPQFFPSTFVISGCLGSHPCPFTVSSLSFFSSPFPHPSTWAEVVSTFQRPRILAKIVPENLPMLKDSALVRIPSGKLLLPVSLYHFICIFVQNQSLAP